MSSRKITRRQFLTLSAVAAAGAVAPSRRSSRASEPQGQEAGPASPTAVDPLSQEAREEIRSNMPQGLESRSMQEVKGPEKKEVIDTDETYFLAYSTVPVAMTGDFGVPDTQVLSDGGPTLRIVQEYNGPYGSQVTVVDNEFTIEKLAMPERCRTFIDTILAPAIVTGRGNESSAVGCIFDRGGMGNLLTLEIPHVEGSMNNVSPLESADGQSGQIWATYVNPIFTLGNPPVTVFRYDGWVYNRDGQQAEVTFDTNGVTIPEGWGQDPSTVGFNATQFTNGNRVSVMTDTIQGQSVVVFDNQTNEAQAVVLSEGFSCEVAPQIRVVRDGSNVEYIVLIPEKSTGPVVVIDEEGTVHEDVNLSELDVSGSDIEAHEVVGLTTRDFDIVSSVPATDEENQWATDRVGTAYIRCQAQGWEEELLTATQLRLQMIGGQPVLVMEPVNYQVIPLPSEANTDFSVTTSSCAVAPVDLETKLVKHLGAVTSDERGIQARNWRGYQVGPEARYKVFMPNASKGVPQD